MKTIIKHIEPYSFTKWKTNHPTILYNDLHNYPSVKARLKFRLMSEQKHLCCYCEKLIGTGTSHIEHFNPKSKSPHLQLDYDNLHASCGLTPSQGTDSQCGHKKGDAFPQGLLSPLKSTCTKHFKFTLDGRINSTSQDGQTTINTLNLNSALLVKNRRNLIDYFLNDITDSERPAELAVHLSESGRKYGEFFSMIQYLSKNNYF